MSEQKALAHHHITGRLTAAFHSNAFDEPSLYASSVGLKRMFIPGGQILFRENEAADSLYFVISGCLGVIVRDSTGPDVLIARVAAGETVGEMAFLDGGVRSATVEALRDTELLKLDKTSYEDLLVRNPGFVRALMSLLVRRLRSTTRPSNTVALPARTVAIVPLDLEVNHRSVAVDLQKKLSEDGLRGLLLDGLSSERTNNWFNDVEIGNDITLYCAEPSNQNGRTAAFVRPIVFCSLHRQPRALRYHPGSPTRLQYFADQLILFCFMAAGEMESNLLRHGGPTCRST
jgi:NTE family protein